MSVSQMDASNSSTATSENSDKRKRLEAEDEDEVNGEALRYKCRFCSKRFLKSQALGGHMNSHRPEREKESLDHAAELVFGTALRPALDSLNPIPNLNTAIMYPTTSSRFSEPTYNHEPSLPWNSSNSGLASQYANSIASDMKDWFRSSVLMPADPLSTKSATFNPKFSLDSDTTYGSGTSNKPNHSNLYDTHGGNNRFNQSLENPAASYSLSDMEYKYSSSTTYMNHMDHGSSQQQQYGYDPDMNTAIYPSANEEEEEALRGWMNQKPTSIFSTAALQTTSDDYGPSVMTANPISLSSYISAGIPLAQAQPFLSSSTTIDGLDQERDIKPVTITTMAKDADSSTVSSDFNHS